MEVGMHGIQVREGIWAELEQNVARRLSGIHEAKANFEESCGRSVGSTDVVPYRCAALLRRSRQPSSKGQDSGWIAELVCRHGEARQRHPAR